MKVLVAHPGTQHSLRLAVACQKAGLLSEYATQLYWDESRLPYAAARVIPGLRERLSKRMVRRTSPELDPRLVRDLNPWADALLFGLKKLRLDQLREQWRWRSQSTFSRKVAELARASADAVVCYDTAAEATFNGLEGSSVARILDLSHPHAQGYRILEEERRLQPYWADTSDAPSDHRVIERCIREERLADRVIVASTFSRNCVVQDGVAPERISIIPYGVDLNRFTPRDPPPVDPTRPLKVLFVGQVGQRKGISYLLEAMKQLGDRRVELTICGALIGNPRKIASHAGPRVRVLGRVSESDLESHFRTADVFVFPSLVEGFGLVLLEALASGLPIIATTHSGGPDIISDGEEGFVIEPRSVEALAASIASLEENRTRAREMRVRARARAEQFPWSRYELGVASAIRDSAAGHRIRGA